MIKSILTLGILRGNTCTKGCYLNKTDVIIIVNISKVILNTKRNKDCASLLLVRLRSGYSTQSEDPRYLQIWKCQIFPGLLSPPPPPPSWGKPLTGAMFHKGAWNISADNSETLRHKDLRLREIVKY